MGTSINPVETQMIRRMDRSLPPVTSDGLYGPEPEVTARKQEQNKKIILEPGLHPQFVRWLDPVLAAAEGGTQTRVVVLDNAASGVSLGRFQMDLTQQTALRRALARFARRNMLDLTDAGPVNLDTLCAKPTRVMTAAERAQAALLCARVLTMPGAVALLTQYERAKLVVIGLSVRQLMAEAAPGAVEFVNGLRGQIELACHLHQFGCGSTQRLAAFLKGRRVAFVGEDGQTRSASFTGTLSVEQFRNFRRATRWGAANPRANESRHTRIDLAYKKLAQEVSGL